MGAQTGRDFVKTLNIERCKSTKNNMAPHPSKTMRLNQRARGSGARPTSEVALQRLPQHGLQLLDRLLALTLHFFTFI